MPEQKQSPDAQYANDLLGEQAKTQILTYAQTRVGLSFNHGEGDIFKQVNLAKQTCANAIDQMNDLRSTSTSDEYKALATITIRKLQYAQMQMVKAITWKDYYYHIYFTKGSSLLLLPCLFKVALKHQDNANQTSNNSFHPNRGV